MAHQGMERRIPACSSGVNRRWLVRLRHCGFSSGCILWPVWYFQVWNRLVVIPKWIRFKPAYWGILIFAVAEILTFCVISRENVFLEAEQIYVPSQPSQVISLWPGPVTSPSGEVTQTSAYSSLGPILIYFFAVVVILSAVFFLIPISALKLVFRILFALLFCWSVFIILVLWLPLSVTIVLSVAVGFGWFFLNRVWLHDLVMIVAMVGLGAVFGRFITPWTAMVLLSAIAIYDLLAVRFGYMLWMIKKLGQSSTLPAFIIPRRVSEWSSSLRPYSGSTADEPSVNKYSILGGGDVAFSLLLASSVYFAHGFNSALVVAVFSLLGLVGAYWSQATFFKGKPVPALPPIAILSLIGILIVV